ncbi:MAG: translation initiation factor IF-2 subunit beta, partial [Candidatus Thermoplasmatota archaeon]
TVVTTPDALIEGKTTVVRNFGDIVDSLRRDQSHLLHYLLRELGTAGNIDGRRAIFKRKLSSAQIKECIDAYVSMYVLCAECNRPDTHLVKEERVLILECEACGARRSVKAIKAAPREEAAALEERKVYEVLIEDVGKKGDGVARIDRYVIFVPGTSKGARVKIKIDKIMGTVAYAHLTNE